MKSALLETDVGAAMASYYRDCGATVYPEVLLGQGRIDLVAHQPPYYHVVECKVRPTLELVAQAVRRIGVAHSVSFATGIGRARTDLKEIAKALGFGVFTLIDGSLYCDVPAKLMREIPRERLAALRRACTPEHLAMASPAGSKTSLSWTPWKQLCCDVWNALSDKPNQTSRELAATLGRKSYWKTPAETMRGLTRHIYRGALPLIETVDSKTPYRFRAQPLPAGFGNVYDYLRGRAARWTA